MKYLITESRLNQTIKQYIESNYDYVVSVSFNKKNVLSAGQGYRVRSVTLISVIVDPYKILEGNISGSFQGYDRDIRRNIRNDLKIFGLGLDKYGSDWDIEVFGIRLEVI